MRVTEEQVAQMVVEIVGEGFSTEEQRWVEVARRWASTRTNKELYGVRKVIECELSYRECRLRERG